MAEARSSPARSFLPKLSRGGEGPSESGKWIRKNGPALLMLTFVFLLALFVRSYFAFEMSAENGYIVSGGSDSYYWRRIVDYHVETGLGLFKDPLLNYPDNLVNPRPPFFSMSVAVPAVLTEWLFESVDDATGFFFVWSTAFWGALTVIPVYFLGKEIFGRRVGMASAFFFAVIPAHIQRSVLSNADHDALILFLIVTVFYFLLKAIRVQEHKKWVLSWKSRASIASGLKDYFKSSRTALLYALMAGTAYATLMLTWVGFAYVTVIILVYYIIQLFVNMFRYQDSLSITMVILVMMAFGYALAFPYYANYLDSFFDDRFLVPVLLTAGGLFFGSMFVVSRDYPWTISLPAIVGISAAIIAGLSLFLPWLGEAILTGQGYFSTSKLYSTIAEARAPQFSELALSFGMVTFFLSLTGLLYAITRIPKRTGAEYIFMVVWLAAAIFMAISAGRFMFNAAPAFAVAAGWVFVIIVDALDFESARRTITGASGSFLTVMRKSVKIRHVVGVLFLGFLVLLPNVWYSVDAGIPSESKRSYDKEIYFSMPSFMRPGGYDEINGSSWYLGAFGYSLPLPSYYYPAAWDWFAEQDSDIYPASSKPAYVAWWDYGFEAVAEGDHPTVADNFQNGYQFTGNVIMAQSEEDAIALFALRLVQGAVRLGGDMEAGAASAMDKYGVDTERMYEILRGPAQEIIDEVLSDPEVYGPMSSDLSDANARIVAGRVELARIGMDSLVGLYDDLCAATGWEIRYFNVDSRMFPISAYETGIFYAPAKLSDRRLDGSTPYDFYAIKAIDSNDVEHDLDEVTADMTIVSYEIVYDDMFYDSMFYRAMCGLSGSDIGLADGGLPGVSGTVQKVAAMPAWNLTHFRVVYRTAYYNPYPSEEVAYHSGDWRAISYEEAIELNKKISAGEATGVVDYSASSLYQSGTVFLKYYHGAYVNGTVTTESGYPAEGLWVTVQDEFGIPHQLVKTDADGRYSVLAPFGNVTVIISEGSTKNQGLTGSNTITSMKFNVTDDQAMRIRQDLDGDGILDYMITKDYVMKDSQVYGDLFWDNDFEGNYTSQTDDLILDAVVYAVDTAFGTTYTYDAPDGSYEGYLPPGQYDIFALAFGANLSMGTGVNITAGGKTGLDLALDPAVLAGLLMNPDGSFAGGIELIMEDLMSDAEFHAVTSEDGAFSFDQLLSSKYIMTTTEEGKMLFDERVAVDSSLSERRNVTLWDKCSISVRVTAGGAPAPYAAYVITDDYNPDEAVSGLTDKYGWVRMDLPPGPYTLRAIYSSGSGSWAGHMSLDLISASEKTGTLPAYEAYEVSGILLDPDGQDSGGDTVVFVTTSGSRLPVETDNNGMFQTLLPAGDYTVVSTSVGGSGIYGGELTVSGDMSDLVFQMSEGVRLSGFLYKDVDGDGEASPEERAPYARLTVTDSDGRVYTRKSGSTSYFALVFPKGETTTVRMADPGYTSWSQDYLYGSDSMGVDLLISPDDVEVTGTLMREGTGLVGVTISFIPEDGGLPTVTVVSGAYGRYSALLAPRSYTVMVSQELDNTPGAWYQHESELTIAPRGSPLELDVEVVLRINVHGTVLGAAQDIVVRFIGPEQATLNLSVMLTYSVYLMPGEYSVYATGRIGSALYASMSSVEVSATQAEQDVQMERAYELTGYVTIGGVTVRDPVTVTVISSQGIEVTNKSLSNGYYALVLPRGTYGLSFLLEDIEQTEFTNLYVEYWDERVFTMGTADVMISPDLSMRLDNTTLGGAVLDEDGDPITATVELFPNGRYGLYTAISTSSSGLFSAQVQPGQYTVYVSRAVDRRVAVSYVEITRNVDTTADLQMSLGQFLEGRLTVAGEPSYEEVKVSRDDMTLSVLPSGDGYFELLLPQGTYTVTSDAERIEGGMTVSYGQTKTVSIEESSVYVDLLLVRNTRRTVDVYWNESRTATLAVGQTVSYVLRVENTGNIADTYSIAYSGTEFEVEFEPAQVWVDFGSNGDTAYVIANIVVGETAVSGNNTLAVTLTSKTQSSTRDSVDLKVVVLPSRSVSVESLNTSEPISSSITKTTFLLNNTGNTEDDFIVSVINTDELNISGWSARIVDAESGELVTNVTLDAFGSRLLMVEFKASRLAPDPIVSAVVMAQSTVSNSVTGYGSVPVMLADLVLGPGGLEVVRDDVTYEYDIGRVYLDIALAVSLVALVVVFFVMRRRKGLGGGGKK